VSAARRGASSTRVRPRSAELSPSHPSVWKIHARHTEPLALRSRDHRQRRARLRLGSGANVVQLAELSPPPRARAARPAVEASVPSLPRRWGAAASPTISGHAAER